MGVEKSDRRCKRGDCSIDGQQLDKRIFNGYPTANDIKGRPHLTIRQHIPLPRCGGGERDDPDCPSDVEIHDQEVYTPLVIVIDTMPL